jgi:hypothetical protein
MRCASGPMHQSGADFLCEVEICRGVDLSCEAETCRGVDLSCKAEICRGVDLSCEAEIRARQRLVVGVPLMGNWSEMQPTGQRLGVLPVWVLTRFFSPPCLESLT